ncbi:kinase-like domain-containing protein [Xylariaceae sp. FL1651]|nr:kinase-like domain-containing protein [Xylariaceae sp. FL1651]
MTEPTGGKSTCKLLLGSCVELRLSRHTKNNGDQLFCIQNSLKAEATGLEDPESDKESASGVSASPTPSDSMSLLSFPYGHNSSTSNSPLTTIGNIHYASIRRMCEFRSNYNHANWNALLESLKEGLTGDPSQQSAHYHFIGLGGSSSVWGASFEVEGSNQRDTLAVKMFRFDSLGDPHSEPKELEIMTKMKHNHIAAYVGHFKRQDQVGIVMYPLAICNLAQLLKHLAKAEASCITNMRHVLLAAMGCLSSAVMYLHHSQKVKHKDIKPENILVDRFGSVHLADFGISKQYKRKTDTDGCTPFTEMYAAPEVVKQQSRDLSSDIFSLGCVFLEICTILRGKSLEEMGMAVFGHESRGYHHSLSNIGLWVSGLKQSKHIHQASSQHFQSDANGAALSGDWCITESHLEIIVLMMSESPEERPSIHDVYYRFKDFSALCRECHENFSGYGAGEVHEPAFPTNQMAKRYIIRPSTVDKSAPLKLSLRPVSDDLLILRKIVSDIVNEFFPRMLCQDNEASRNYDTKPATRRENDRKMHLMEKRLRAKVFLYLQSHAPSYLSSHTPFKPQMLGTSATESSHPVSPVQHNQSKRSRSTPHKTSIYTRPNGNQESDEENWDHKGKNNDLVGNANRNILVFVCPYHVREPERYSSPACRNGYPIIARLKEHLGRTHRVYHCTRCWRVCDTEDEAEQDVQRDFPVCGYRPYQDVFTAAYDWGRGYGKNQDRELRQRQKTKSEPEKYAEIKRILFPFDFDSNLPDTPGIEPNTEQQLEYSPTKIDHSVDMVENSTTLLPRLTERIEQVLQQIATEQRFQQVRQAMPAAHAGLPTEAWPFDRYTVASTGQVLDLTDSMSLHEQLDQVSQADYVQLQMPEPSNLTNDSAYCTLPQLSLAGCEPAPEGSENNGTTLQEPDLPMDFFEFSNEELPSDH